MGEVGNNSKTSHLQEKVEIFKLTLMIKLTNVSMCL